MKSNKGFTLIELLAVIVILAIIALIATPTILGVIETARKGSAESSALGYIDAVEKQIAIDMLETEASGKTLVGEIKGTLTVGSEGFDKKLVTKGTKPSSGNVTVDADKGTITGAFLVIPMSSKYYCVKYDGSKADAKAIDSKSSTCDQTIFEPQQ